MAGMTRLRDIRRQHPARAPDGDRETPYEGATIMADTSGPRVLVVYYSMFGHIHRMAQAIAEGARAVPGAAVAVRRVPETLPQQTLAAMGALAAQESMAAVPIADVEELAGFDAIVVGTPTRFGNMCGQMRQFLDGAGGLWSRGALVGKVGSVFTSSATQHGGQESTILSTHTTLLHLGLVIVGLPYAFAGQTRLDEITGGSPYGASTIAGAKGERLPSDNELAGARWQGRHVAAIAAKLGA
jgi:NAD(P)H dehydrogenase (quinone)